MQKSNGKKAISFKEYNLLPDLRDIYFGKISFEIGDKSYAEIKRESTLLGVDLRYRSVSADEYFSLREYGLTEVSHAAFIKQDKVNLVFVPENSELIDKCINLYHKSKELERAEAEKPSPDVREPVGVGER